MKKGTATDWQRLSQAPEVEGSGKDVLCSPQACGSVIGTGLVEFVEIRQFGCSQYEQGLTTNRGSVNQILPVIFHVFN